MLSSSKTEEVSQNSFVFKLADRQVDRQTQTDTDRHRQTQTDTDRHRQTQTDTDRQTERDR